MTKHYHRRTITARDRAYFRRVSDRLKGQADTMIFDYRQRPATVLQLLAAEMLDPERAACMTVDELAAECARWTRAEVSESLEERSKQ